MAWTNILQKMEVNNLKTVYCFIGINAIVSSVL